MVRRSESPCSHVYDFFFKKIYGTSKLFALSSFDFATVKETCITPGHI